MQQAYSGSATRPHKAGSGTSAGGSRYPAADAAGPRPPGPSREHHRRTAVPGPRCCAGRIRRRGGSSVATTRRPRRRTIRTRRNGTTSETLPRFQSVRRMVRRRPCRTSRSPRMSSRRTTCPRTRTSTTTPTCITMGTGAPARGRVRSRTSASCSPGPARRGTTAETVTLADRPAPRASRRGASTSHRPTPPAVAIRGRPRGSSANPADATSTTTLVRPGFVTRTADHDPASTTMRVGDAESASGGRSAPAPASTDARADTVASATEAITGESP